MLIIDFSKTKKDRAMEKIREEEAQAFKAYVQSLQTDTK